ncbi:hypothetical protein D7Z26_00255 [Cohnella endophytica]|uniref:Intracellular proteinase inhibitor BsuPI domain-containing protein n=1 Tax=Cohnella endophytica TaxID=2419778 RepID=A0A494Y6P9_9BACL|nr:hypothetical protein [Cohnella endophytica]RKP57984.1 hypothetical protein D7Z26_00255 [Cohnella endophytica]
MKYTKIIILMFLIFTLLGCTEKSKEFPKENDFTISSSVSNMSPKVGEEITINTKLINKTEQNFDVQRGPKLILVQYRKIEDPVDLIIEGPGYQDTIWANNEYANIETIKIEEPGKYKINITASFSIKMKNEYKNYRINSEKLIVEVG